MHLLLARGEQDDRAENRTACLCRAARERHARPGAGFPRADGAATHGARFFQPAGAAAPAVPGLGGATAGPRPASELRAVARQALTKLADQLEAAKRKAKDPLTVAHLDDLHREIAALFAADKKK